MARVDCPVCENSIIVLPEGGTYRVSGVFDASKCLELKAVEGVDDPLECVVLEATVDEVMASGSGGG